MNDLQAIVYIWQLWMLRTYDAQKHKVLDTWELYGIFIKFQCVQNLVFLRISHCCQITTIRYSQFEF